VQVALCPPRRGNRKGVVEKANHVAAQRWWRTLSDDVTVEQAQMSLSRWCATRGDLRMRFGGADGKMTVATVAEREPLAALPALALSAGSLALCRPRAGRGAYVACRARQRQANTGARSRYTRTLSTRSSVRCRIVVHGTSTLWSSCRT